MDNIEFIAMDILNNTEYRKLDEFTHHVGTTRLKHSEGVARIALEYHKRWGGNLRDIIRASLLHDFYLQDWKCGKWSISNHLLVHPYVALRNAKRHFKLTPVQEDAILSHMWPISVNRPQYRESLIVCLADKHCTSKEIIGTVQNKIKSLLKNN